MKTVAHSTYEALYSLSFLSYVAFQINNYLCMKQPMPLAFLHASIHCSRRTEENRLIAANYSPVSSILFSCRCVFHASSFLQWQACVRSSDGWHAAFADRRHIIKLKNKVPKKLSNATLGFLCRHLQSWSFKHSNNYTPLWVGCDVSYLFIGHKLESRFRCYLQNVHAISPPQWLHATFMQHVLQTCD
jgi:hypothetical protein